MGLPVDSIQNRTTEFLAALDTFRAAKNIPKPANSNVKATSEFAQTAAQIGKDIHQTSLKLERLTKLAQRRSLFDDPSVEIQELTYVIKQDIAGLNSKLDELLKMRQQSRGSNQAYQHSETVVHSLKSKLMHTAEDFKDVLKMRTDSLQAQQDRRSRFTGTDSATKAPKTDKIVSGSDAVAIDMGSGSLGAEANSSGSSSAQFKMQLAMTRPEQSYLQARSDAVRQVESTISELGQIFNQLATMVKEQGEMVQRIDTNVEDTLINMEEGQNQLVKYFNGISSNRGLMLKIFATLFIFIIIWVMLA